MRHLTTAFSTLLMTLSFLAATPAQAMDGVVTDTGDIVTVEDGTVFTEGDSVTVFDSDGTTHTFQVMAVTDTPESTSVDFIDEESGDAKTVEFSK